MCESVQPDVLNRLPFLQGFLWLEARTAKGIRPHVLDLSFEGSVTYSHATHVSHRTSNPRRPSRRISTLHRPSLCLSRQVSAPRIKVLPKHVELNFTKEKEGEWLGLPNQKREKPSKKATHSRPTRCDPAKLASPPTTT